MEANNGSASGAGASTVDETEDPSAAVDTAQPAETEDERKARIAAELEGMKALSADDILGSQDMTTEWVPVKEWGGKVLIRSLSGKERDQFEGSIVTQKGKHRVHNTDNIRAKLAQLSIIDPTDPNPDISARRSLFTAKQIDKLGRKSAAALDRVYDAAARLSGLTAADVEELAGNSGAAAGEGLSSS